MNVTSLWENSLEIINKKVNPISFNTWFKDANLINLDNGKAVIEVPMPMQKNLLAKNYYELIEETFLNLTGINYDIEFILSDEKEEVIEEESTKTVEDFNSNINAKYTFDTFLIGESNRDRKSVV